MLARRYALAERLEQRRALQVANGASSALACSACGERKPIASCQVRSRAAPSVSPDTASQRLAVIRCTPARYGWTLSTR